MTDRPPHVWAIVPVKNLPQAKQRLAGVLSASERRALFRAMLEDVLGALSKNKSIAGILVVTRDDEATTLAASYGARVLEEAENRGHTAASSFGARINSQFLICFTSSSLST